VEKLIPSAASTGRAVERLNKGLLLRLKIMLLQWDEA
jgi:hypothetical protein